MESRNLIIKRRIVDTINKQIKNELTSRLFFHWYVNKHVGEENNVMQIVTLLERVKDSGEGILIISHNLRSRIFVTQVITQGA